MNVLVVDVGGTNVKILATGQDEPRRFPSGPKMTPEQMVSGVKELAGEWKYDVVSIGYPGRSSRVARLPNRIISAAGGSGFDFEAAFECPVKLINDAAMQALGSYKGGTLLFLGLGTGLGSALVVDGIVVPMELGHLPYRKGTYEDYVGVRGIEAARAKRNGGNMSTDVSGPPDRCSRSRGRGSRRRKRQETGGAASRLPRGQQRQCVPRRISSVGGRRHRRADAR